jgi:hypothetical protein
VRESSTLGTLALAVALGGCGFDGQATLATSASSTEPGSGAPHGAQPIAGPAPGVAPPVPGVPVTPCSDTTLAFDGIDDVATVPDDGALDLSNDFTVEAWIRPGAKAATGAAMVLVSHHDANDSKGWALLVKDGHLVASVYGSEVLSSKSFSAGESGSKYVVPGAWAHVAATLQGNALRVYYGGVLRDTVQLGGLLFGRDTYKGALRLGRAAAVSDFYFEGELDDVRLSRTARYTGATAPKPSAVLSLDDQTVAAWRFDESGGYTLVDATTHHDGSFAPDPTAPMRLTSTCIADR